MNNKGLPHVACRSLIQPPKKTPVMQADLYILYILFLLKLRATCYTGLRTNNTTTEENTEENTMF